MNKITPTILALVTAFIPVTPLYAAGEKTAKLNVAIADATISLSTGTIEPIQVTTNSLQVIEVGAPRVSINPTDSLKAYAQKLVYERFGAGQFSAFDAIITRESGWNPDAVNRSSGAYGLPQALPASKITDKTPEGQLKWAVQYMANRYGSPNQAWAFWRNHNWY